jgi:hypothetical protein
LITDHAIERYVERVFPALPLKEVANLPAVLFETRRILETFAPRSTAIRARTHAGQEQRRLDRPKPCTLVCKHDPGAIAVVTVLGQDDTLTEVDEEIVESWERFLSDSFTEKSKIYIKKQLESKPGPRPDRAAALAGATDLIVRRVVVPLVRNEIGPAIDKLVATESGRRSTAEGKIDPVLCAKERERTERRRLEVEMAARKQAEKTERLRLHNARRDHALRVAIRALDRLAGESAVAAEALVQVAETDPTLLGMIEPKKDEQTEKQTETTNEGSAA